MENHEVVAVVLAGGSGTRLWPMSRQMFPKQFMSLDGGKSLLQATVSRLLPVLNPDGIWVVTSMGLVGGAGYRELAGMRYVVEPVARNTAPAIGMMSAYFEDFEQDPVMVILPADHVIADVPAFHAALEVAVRAAKEGKVVTFGIEPTHPEVGFGYIRAVGEGSVRPVEAFVEKPDLATAEGYLREGCYTWNSGMFVVRASVMLAELAQHAPEMAKVLDRMRAAWAAGEDWRAVVAREFEAMPSESIDYAVMEKSRNVVVVPCRIGWSDVGSWEAVHDLLPKDGDGNAVQGPAVVVESRNCLLMGKERLIAAVGVEDVCIVDTPDAVLVVDRKQTQKVKAVVDELKKRGGETHVFHRTVQRPWGSFTVLEDGATGYKLKRIEVVPGGRLSLQSHKHRSEHWVVVAGVATVTNGDTVATLHPGQSTYIPVGTKHRLENLGEAPVQIVEVQVGDYLGEDDIVRYEDMYSRV